MKTGKKKRTNPLKFNTHKHISKAKVAQMIKGLIQSGQILSYMAKELKNNNKIIKQTDIARRLDFWQNKFDEEKCYLPEWLKN